MLPEVAVHSPRGVLPGLSLGRRTVVHVRPSWLLLAVPTIVAVRVARRQARAGGTAAVAAPLGGVSAPAGSARSERLRLRLPARFGRPSDVPREPSEAELAGIRDTAASAMAQPLP
jgi:hypothetical protein